MGWFSKKQEQEEPKETPLERAARISLEREESVKFYRKENAREDEKRARIASLHEHRNGILGRIKDLEYSDKITSEQESELYRLKRKASMFSYRILPPMSEESDIQLHARRRGEFRAIKGILPSYHHPDED